MKCECRLDSFHRLSRPARGDESRGCNEVAQAGQDVEGLGGKAGEVGDSSDGGGRVGGQGAHEGLEEGVLVKGDRAVVGERDDGSSSSRLQQADSEAFVGAVDACELLWGQCPHLDACE